MKPTFRTDWSGLRNILDAAIATIEKQTTFELRSAHLDELARIMQDGIAAAVAEEREACAKIVTEFELEADETAPDDYIDGYEAGVNELSVFSAQAIRNRSNT